MNENLVVFLQGICAALAWAIGRVFLQFWKDHRDPLFAYFGAAFWMLALNWTLLPILGPTDEARPYVYVLRLFAFLLIIAAIVAKNRREHT